MPASPLKSVFKTYLELNNFWYFYYTGPSDLSSGWLQGTPNWSLCFWPVPSKLLSTLYLEWAFCPLSDPVTLLLRVSSHGFLSHSGWKPTLHCLWELTLSTNSCMTSSLTSLLLFEHTRAFPVSDPWCDCSLSLEYPPSRFLHVLLSLLP